MSYAVASESVGRSVEAKPSFMTMGGAVASGRVVLAAMHSGTSLNLLG
jgi:hypothetical protein